MKCNTYIDKVQTIKSVSELSQEEKKHIENCVACKSFTQEYFHFLELVDKEKSLKVSPFLATRVMAQIEKSQRKYSYGFNPLLTNAALFIITLTVGFFSAYMFENYQTTKQQDEQVFQYFSSAKIGFDIENNWINNDLHEE